MPLADRYHEIMAFRREGLRKYRANESSTLGGPPAQAFFPLLARTGSAERSRRVGPFMLLDRPPLWRFVDGIVRRTENPLNVLEIGPGNGDLFRHLRDRSGARVGAYFGVERDPNVEGGYQRIDTPRQVGVPIDVVIASEVIEHMTADAFETLLGELATVLDRSGTLLLSTPNPTSPGGIARDFTHVQNYPWYDLYAILRLHFENVDITRTHYAWSASRLAFLLPRRLICPAIELDWCDGLIAMATRPIAAAR